jgi:hypothetical protein
MKMFTSSSSRHNVIFGVYIQENKCTSPSLCFAFVLTLKTPVHAARVSFKESKLSHLDTHPKCGSKQLGLPHTSTIKYTLPQVRSLAGRTGFLRTLEIIFCSVLLLSFSPSTSKLGYM